MSRVPDGLKRKAILSAAKRLFARHGFQASSVSALAAEAGLPVGSVYTYFSGKDEILSVVIDEGWTEFSAFIGEGLASCSGPAGRLGFLVRRALPALYSDIDLIAILLKEGAGAGGLAAKLDILAALVTQSLAPDDTGTIDGHGRGVSNTDSAAAGQTGAIVPDLPPGLVRTALAVILLGSLDAISLGSRTDLGIGRSEVEEFIVSAVESALGIRLP